MKSFSLIPLIDCARMGQALGEAEAKLAQLNIHHLIDAVLTVDSDIFVFGAQFVLRSPNNENRDEVLVYTADRLENEPGVQLTRGAFLLISLLVNGDYDPSVPNVGIVLAHQLAKCEYGEDLLHPL
ncbi:hypothetical protein BDN72DRAFT_906569 [Pluteus cervinus]|uniref:Uncharacterized protein n=1 Tax=Pluteus cervinus TaxID=181527 RepID=A0ACD2ZZW6_9AGAR|nr:hypothetical protein BDN72DRAFT_906569 [Pluteus cervinus]